MNGDDIASTSFMYKIVPSVNLQTSNLHQICIVCNKNNNRRVFNLSVENTLIVFGRDI